MNKGNQQQQNQNELNKNMDMITSLIYEYLYKKENNKTLVIFKKELYRKQMKNIIICHLKK